MNITSNTPTTRTVGTDYSVGRDKGLASPAITAWKNDVQKSFLKLSRVPKPRLSFLTVLVGAVVIDRDTPPDMVGEIITDFQRRYISRCRRKLPGMRTVGVFEVDVLCPWLPGDRAHKEAFLGGLGIDIAQVGRHQRVLLPHIHAVVDRGSHSQVKLHDELGAEFQGPWRVLAKRLHDDKSVRENLVKIAGYCSKLKVAYSDFGPDRSTRFNVLYEDCWRDTLVDVIDLVGLDDLMFTHGCS